jgi:uncharacterized membrane protein YgcG
VPKVAVVIEVADAQAVAGIKNFQRATLDAFAAVKSGDPALRNATARVQELTTAKGKASTVANEWSGILNILPGQIGAVASQAQALSSVLGRAGGAAGLVGGILAVTAASVGMVRSLADDIERLDNLKVQTGLAVASLQAFEHAARQAGEAPETLVQGLGRVNQEINNVLTGAPNAGKAFQAIGVDLRALVRDGKSTEDILEATAVALKGIEDPQRRAAAQMEIFGTRGRAMSTVLDTIAQKSLPGYVGELEQAGIVTSEVTNKMAREWDLFFDRLEQRSRGWWIQFKADIADAITTLSDVLTMGPSAAGTLARLRQNPPHEIVRPGVLGAGAGPLGRTVPEDPEIARKALEDAKKHMEDLGQAARLLNRDMAEGSALLTDQIEADTDRRLKKTDEEIKAFETWRTNLDDVVPTLTLQIRTQQDLTAAGERWRSVLGETMGLMAETTQDGERLWQLNLRLSSGYEDLSEDYKLSTDELQNFDAELARGAALAEGASGSVERFAASNAHLVVNIHESTSALTLFGQGLEAETQRLRARFTDWTDIGEQTAQDLHRAFSDSFFSLMKGDLDDLDDAWKGFLDAVLRHIADFLAAEAVSGLLGFVRDLGKFDISGLGGGSSSGSSSGSSFDFGDAAAILSTGLSFLETKTAGAAVAMDQAGDAAARLGDAAKGAADNLGDVATASSGQGGDLSGLKDVLGGSKAQAGAKIGGLAGLAGPIFGIVGTIAGAVIGAAMDKYEKEVLGFITAVSQARLSFMAARPELEALGDEADRIASESGFSAGKFNDASRRSVEAYNAMTDAQNAAKEALGKTTEATVEFGFQAAEMGAAVAAAAEAAGRAADIAQAAAEAVGSSGGEGGGGGGGGGDTGPSGTGGGGPGGGSGPFAVGGFVTRPTRALIGERFPEMVLGPPSKQRFAREFASAIAQQLGGREQTALLRKQTTLMKQQNDILLRLSRGGGRPGGTQN